MEAHRPPETGRLGREDLPADLVSPLSADLATTSSSPSAPIASSRPARSPVMYTPSSAAATSPSRTRSRICARASAPRASSSRICPRTGLPTSTSSGETAPSRALLPDISSTTVSPQPRSFP